MGMKSHVQGVGDGPNSLLFATFLGLNLTDGEEEEDGCQDRKEVGGRRHFNVCQGTGLLGALPGGLLWEKDDLAEANRCYRTHDASGSFLISFDRIAQGKIVKLPPKGQWYVPTCVTLWCYC